MKKILLLISIFSIAASSYAQYGIHAINWPVTEEGVTMVSETSFFSEGATSAKVSSVENKAAFRSGRFDVVEGAAFTFSIDVLDNSEDAKLRLYFYFRDECGSELWSTSVYSTDAADWNTLTISNTVPDGAVAADVKFKVYDDNDIPLYIDNASYTENGGDNQFVNSGFENWAELAIPSVNNDHQVASDKNGSYVVASSNAATGKIYVVKESVVIATQADLDAAVTAGNASSADIVAAETNVEILTTGLELGTYFCYAVDGSGNVSEKSRDCIEVAFAYDFLPQYWPVYEEGVTLTREKEIVKERTTSLKITSTENKAAFRSERFVVTPGAEFSLNMDILDNTSDGKLRAYFYFRDKCGNNLSSSSQYSEDSGDWGTLTFSGTVPADAVAADIKFKVYDDEENPLYLDNVTYTENGGDNLFTNSYFEYWENVITPRADCEVQTVGTASGSSALASSNANAGFLYLVEENEAATTADELEAAVVAGKGAKAPIDGSTEISTSGLAEGTYFAYAVDEYGSVSNKSTSCVTLVSSYAYLPEFWTTFEEGVEIRKEKIIVKERTTSLKVLTSVYKAAFRSGSFDVTPGETFTFSIDVMDTTSVSKLRCYFYFRDNCGNELESTSEYSVDSNDWESIVISGTVPGGAVTADVKFKVYDKVGHALFVDNASYREGAGENIFPNPYFEYWQDIFAPWIRYDSQTVSNGPDVKVTFSTNGSTGNVYLVPDTLSEYTQASLDALVTEQKANKAALSTDPEQLEIATSSLIPGAYKLIVIDGAGYISDEFVACLDIIEFDNVPPVVTAATQEATTSEGQYVLAQSNELGWVYIIMDGEPVTRATELEAAIMAQKGAKSAVGAVDTDTQISTENLADGTYYAYAVDEQFNISLKGENQIIITYPVGIKDIAEMGVNVYPNPVNNVLNISQAQQINKFVVTNISGQTVESSANQSSIIQVNTSAYSPGIYFLQIYSKDGATGKLKFVKR
ncbi:T9SS type A sorting domain-containing protein [Mariniphaga sediminis]|uniref:T9SS type A sorting domain-containing protein n=1 Tax=Mariniphaga sediminis TaxID=1628158 RepID=UPI0035671F95